MPTSRLTNGSNKFAVLVASTATVFALAAPPTASAVPDQQGTVSEATSRPGPTADPGFPTFVHLPDDQAAHPTANIEWWYTIGHLQAGGHEYGYEVQLTANGITQIALTDVTSGEYASEQKQFNPGEFSISTSALDVRMPNATLSGPIDNMHLEADLPQGMGTLELTLNAVGPAMYDNGTGLIPFLGGTSYYYSLPNVQTSGTLTVGGETQQVTGTSWLDRQWGTWDWSKLQKWTWMALQLSNGDTVGLWDLFDTTGEKHWATVLSPDGSHRVVSVNPLAPEATNFQTSPTTGQRYAGEWTVTIPSLQTELVVTAEPVLQEIQAGSPFTPGINEAAATVRGTYQGGPVTGDAYVEQFGIWN
jgi:predicted secreted hydrolase